MELVEALPQTFWTESLVAYAVNDDGVELFAYGSDLTSVIIGTYVKGRYINLPRLPADTADGTDVIYTAAGLARQAAELGFTDWRVVDQDQPIIPPA